MAEVKSKGTEFIMGPDETINQGLETAPLIFVDGGIGFAKAEGVVRFNLFQDRLTIGPGMPEDNKGATRIICARLVMSENVAKRIHSWLGDILQIIEQPMSGHGGEDASNK